MKLSIVTPVLDSHEIVFRQVLHYRKMELPDDIEIIYVDDGSCPPIPQYDGLTVYPTGDNRPWTEHKARNIGASIAKGKHLVIIDVDYILPKETIMLAREGGYDKMNFKRWFGILDDDGNIDTKPETLKKYGLKGKWIRIGWVKGHRSQFAIRKDLFDEMGGYREDLEGSAHPLGGGAGQRFFRTWQRLEEDGLVQLSLNQPDVYMFPSGKFCGGIDYNPMGLFHDLKRL